MPDGLGRSGVSDQAVRSRPVPQAEYPDSAARSTRQVGCTGRCSRAITRMAPNRLGGRASSSGTRLRAAATSDRSLLFVPGQLSGVAEVLAPPDVGRLAAGAGEAGGLGDLRIDDRAASGGPGAPQLSTRVPPRGPRSRRTRRADPATGDRAGSGSPSPRSGLMHLTHHRHELLAKSLVFTHLVTDPHAGCHRTVTSVVTFIDPCRSLGEAP